MDKNSLIDNVVIGIMMRIGLAMLSIATGVIFILSIQRMFWGGTYGIQEIGIAGLVFGTSFGLMGGGIHGIELIAQHRLLSKNRTMGVGVAIGGVCGLLGGAILGIAVEMIMSTSHGMPFSTISLLFFGIPLGIIGSLFGLITARTSVKKILVKK